MSEQFIFVEKYRPSKIADCILSSKNKQLFEKIIQAKDLQNMLFYGPAGTGKTTAAKALCEEIGADYIFINGSEESGIDVLRTKIKAFASSVSITGGLKVVILDEADYLNPNSTQPALRGFIEEYAINCRFILTCNFKNKIIAPLHSRCANVDFKIPKAERPVIAKTFFERVQEILKIENVKFDPRVVAKIVEKFFPDFRRTLNEVQRFSQEGEINEGALANSITGSMGELVTHLKEKDWNKIRAWVAQNNDVDPSVFFRNLFDVLIPITSSQSAPQLVVLLADYSYKSAFCADAEINYIACLTEIMASCKLQ